jgi:hypothetical protein
MSPAAALSSTLPSGFIKISTPLPVTVKLRPHVIESFSWLLKNLLPGVSDAQEESVNKKPTVNIIA